MEASLSEFRTMMGKRLGRADINDNQCYWPLTYALRNDGGIREAQLGSWFVTIDEMRKCHPPRFWSPDRHFRDAFDLEILDITDIDAVRAFFAGWDDYKFEDSMIGVARVWLEETHDGRRLLKRLLKSNPLLLETANYILAPSDRHMLFTIAQRVCAGNLEKLFQELSLSDDLSP
jgi:hypothetical protein